MGSKYDRQIELINILMSWQRYKCQNLAFEFGVSVKTIKKDISELMLYYPIETYQGNGGGVEMRKGFVINGFIMKKTHLDLISEALCKLKETNPDPDISILIKYVSRKS